MTFAELKKIDTKLVHDDVKLEKDRERRQN